MEYKAFGELVGLNAGGLTLCGSLKVAEKALLKVDALTQSWNPVAHNATMGSLTVVGGVGAAFLTLATMRFVARKVNEKATANKAVVSVKLK